jgi:hypothetical protein
MRATIKPLYQSVYTTGYEGKDIDEFLEYLGSYNIRIKIGDRSEGATS